MCLQDKRVEHVSTWQKNKNKPQTSFTFTQQDFSSFDLDIKAALLKT